jgi:hypothetical protein
MAVAATTGSTLGNTYQASVVPAELTAAINMIVANQQSLYQHIAPLSQQMATLSFKEQPATQACQLAVHVPPVQHLAIPGPPVYGGYHGGYQQGYQQGRGGGQSTGRCRNGRGNTRWCCGPTTFADHMAAQGRGYGGDIGAFLPAVGNTQRPLNVCYLCGFDIKANHNLMTCPPDWRKPTHDVTFTWDNTQTFLSIGREVCTRGMHKTMLLRTF